VNYPDYYITFLKQYFLAQIDAYEHGDKVVNQHSTAAH
jgi:hypothetical protein